MKRMNFILEKKDAEPKIIEYNVKKLILGGFTGRDKKAIIDHIEELKSKGIKIELPEKIPIFFRVPPYVLTTESIIEVPCSETSGEVEYVILTGKNGKIYITVGSDHTDRELEKISIYKSKWACPKILSEKIWCYDDLKDHWDKIEMSSFIFENGKKELYQSAKLETLLRPEEILRETDYRGEEGWVIYSGTVPTLKGVVYSKGFEINLFDPVLNRRITHRYVVNVIA
jgi:hypothetical protein